MLFYSLAFLAALALPFLLTWCHRRYYASRLDTLILEYRYFVVLNLVVMALIGLVQLYLNVGWVVAFIAPWSAFYVYFLVLLLFSYIAFTVYGILQNRAVCVLPAVLGFVAAVVVVLFFMFQVCHYSAWRVAVSVVGVLYALSVAVMCFRYTCRVMNHYSLSCPMFSTCF